MRLLFVAPGVTAATGITGAAVSIAAWCAALGRHGCSVALLTDLGGRAPDPQAPIVAEEHSDHVTLRAADPLAVLPGLLQAMPPDAAIIVASRHLPPALAACRAARVPAVVYLATPDLQALGATLTEDPGTLHLAQSRFMAARAAAWFGIGAELVPPLIAPPAAAAPPGRHVLFINPVRVKGWEIAAAVAARLPGIPFTILESWGLDPAWRARCQARLAALPHCRWRGSTPDMAAVWADTRLLLMPSVWEEPWGRSASEAQAHGLPVVASDRGGLPEAVGPGGVIVALHDPVERWAAEVRRLMTDPGHYGAVADAARAHAARPEMRPDAVRARFLQLVSAHAERYRAGLGS